MSLRIIVVALVMTTASIANADVNPCSDRDGHDDQLLRKLYFYSLFVEAADSGKLPPWQCEARDARSTRKPPPGWGTARDGERFDVRPLSKDDLKEYGWDEIAKSFRKSGPPHRCL